MRNLAEELTTAREVYVEAKASYKAAKKAFKENLKNPTEDTSEELRITEEYFLRKFDLEEADEKLYAIIEDYQWGRFEDGEQETQSLV